MVDYQPISLCNVLYKLISKLVANRLEALISLLISDVQNAFMPKRQITDNILVAYKVIHFLRMKNKGKQLFISLKLDMSKTYDCVELDYLDCTQTGFSFPNCAMNLIM